MFTVSQKVLSDMLALASRSGGRGSSIAILSCVRIAFGAGLSVSGTDMDKWITASTPDFDPLRCEVAIVQGKQIAALVAALPAGDITLSIGGQNKNKMNVKTATSNYNFSCLPADEWPMVKWEPKHKVTVRGADFAHAVTLVSPCISQDQTRAHLAGIALRHHGQQLRFMASDGHRFAHALAPASGDVTAIDVLLPLSTAALMRDLTADSDAEAVFETCEGRCRMQAQAHYGDVSVISRLVDSTFPETDRLIPYDRQGTMHGVNRQALLSAMSRASKVTEIIKGNPVALSFEGGVLSVIARGDDGDAKEQVPCSDPSAFSFTSNGNYLVRILQSLEGETVVFRGDPANNMMAVLISESDSAVTRDTPRFFVLMPMRG